MLSMLDQVSRFLVMDRLPEDRQQETRSSDPSNERVYCLIVSELQIPLSTLVVSEDPFFYIFGH